MDITHSKQTRRGEQASDEALLRIPGKVREAVRHACHGDTSAKERWEALARTGATNAEIRQAIQREFGISGGSCGPGRLWLHYKGGSNPQLWIGALSREKCPIHYWGTELVNAVREAFNIPQKEHLAPMSTTHSPRLDLAPGEWFEWTENGLLYQKQVRAVDDDGIAYPGGRVPWSARPRKIDPPPPPDIARGITPAAGSQHPPEVALFRIQQSPINLRKTFPEASINSLAHSIQQFGQIDPLLVRPLPRERFRVEAPHAGNGYAWVILDLGEDGKGKRLLADPLGTPEAYPSQAAAEETFPRYELVDGARRYRALWRTDVRMVSIRVREDLTELDIIRIMFETQEQREELDPVDRAEAIFRMQQLGLTQTQAAEEAHLSQGTVSRLVGIVELPEDVKQLGRERRLGDSHLQRLVKWKDRPALCSAIAHAAAENKAPVRDLEAPIPFFELLKKKKLIREIPSELAGHCAGSCPYNAHRKPNHYQHFCLQPSHIKILQAEKAAEQEAKHQNLVAQCEAEGKRLVVDGTYLRVNWKSNPCPGCSAECPCAQYGLDYYGALQTICTDPKRYNGLTNAVALQKQKDRQERLEGLLELAVRDQRERMEVSPRDLLYLCADELKWCVVDDLRKAAEAVGLDPDLVRRHPTTGYVDLAPLYALPVAELRPLLVALALLKEIGNAVKYGNNTQALETILLGEPPPLTEPGEQPESCTRCGAELPSAVVHELYDQMSRALDREPAPVYVGERGQLLVTAHMTPYCAECSKELEICSGCGCTQESGCEGEHGGSCEWIAPGRCSVCGEAPQSEGELPCGWCGTGPHASRAVIRGTLVCLTCLVDGYPRPAPVDQLQLIQEEQLRGGALVQASSNAVCELFAPVTDRQGWDCVVRFPGGLPVAVGDSYFVPTNALLACRFRGRAEILASPGGRALDGELLSGAAEVAPVAAGIVRTILNGEEVICESA